MRLDKNENTVGYSDKFIKRMLKTVTPAMVASYPEPFTFTNKLAAFYNISEKRIIPVSGSDAAIKNVFETFIRPGDAVVRIEPTYAMVGVYCKLFEAREVLCGFDNNLNYDFDSMLRGIRKEAKLVYLANPNSPTGTTLDLGKIRKICDVALKADAVVLIDEAYYYFSSVTAFPLLDKYENLIITRTFSKAMGLASVRLGFMVSSEKIIGWLLRWRPMYEINSFAQHCGCFILDNWKQVERYVHDVLDAREWFIREIRKIGLEAFPSDANFVLVKYPVEEIEKTRKYFFKNGILIKGGGCDFPLSTTLRFSLGVRSQMKKCLKLLKNRPQ